MRVLLRKARIESLTVVSKMVDDHHNEHKHYRHLFVISKLSENIQRIHRSVCTFLTSLRDDWKIFLPRCKHIYNKNKNKLKRKLDWNKYTIVSMVLTSSSSLPAVANVYFKLKDLISVQSKFSATQKEQMIISWHGSLGWSMIIKK